MPKDLTISIVNYKMKDALMDCLESIKVSKNGFDIDVYVVDNNSQDGSVELIRKAYPEIKLIANVKNLGFARANNQVLRIFDSKYCLILNPDVMIFPETLKVTMKFMDKHPEAGISGCKVLNKDRSIQYSCRIFPSLLTILWRVLLLDLFFPDNAFTNEYLMKDYSHDTIMPVDWITGCFMMIRKETIRDIGLMNEKYFLYFEDTDLCLRANKNWKVYYLPCTHIVHEFQHKSRKLGHFFHTLHHLKSAYHFFKGNGFSQNKFRT